VVREHPQRREHEAAVERPDGQRRAALAQQLLEPLQLALVVAQDDRCGRGGTRNDPPQSLQVAFHGLRRAQREALVRFCYAERRAAEPRDPPPPRRRIEE
jgi:hypothetical protein